MSAGIVERLVDRHVLAGDGEAIAYVDVDGSVCSYADLSRRLRGYAARLAQAGVKPGTHGLIVADDSVATVVAVLALWQVGAVPVPVSTMLTKAEIAFIARDCAASYLHTDSRPSGPLLPDSHGTMPRGNSEWARPYDGPYAAIGTSGEQDVALIQYTSGSTGTPKGVLHTGAGIYSVLDGFGRNLSLRPDDILLSTAKLSFGYGFGNSLLFPLAAGACAVLTRGVPDAYSLSASIAKYRPSVLFSVPRMYAALLGRARGGEAPDMSCVRLAVSAGEHLPAAIQKEFVETFRAPLINGLGATEVLHIVVATDGQRPGSTGVAVPGMHITIRDDNGRILPDGAEGNLHAAGGSVAAGYLDRPEATAHTFADGGTYTGDIAVRRPSGDIEFVCRRDDLINIGGFKVSPLEIEAVACGVDGLAQCAVVRSYDESGLEQAVAYAVAAPGTDADVLRRALRRAFRTELPPFKRPAVIEVLPEIPVTSTGKLARFKLRGDRRNAHVTVTTRVLRDGPGRTLLCIPCAGGSAGSFTRLAHSLPPSWRVVAGDATHGDNATFNDVARAWQDASAPYLGEGAVLLGHSLGAALAVEVVASVADRLPGVQVVLCAPPVRLGDEIPAIQFEDDQTLVTSLQRVGLLPATSLTPEETGRLVLPRFRRDITLLADGWEYAGKINAHAIVGTADRLCTTTHVVDRIGRHYLASLNEVDGDHYFVTANAEETAAILTRLFPEGS